MEFPKRGPEKIWQAGRTMKNKFVWAGAGVVVLVAVALVFFSGILDDGPTKPVSPEAMAEARGWFEKGEAIFNGTRWGNPEKAVSNYSKAIKVNPNFAKAYVQRGRIYLGQLNEAEKGKADIKKALRLDEKLPEAHYAMGNVEFFYSQNMDLAISSYDRSIRLQPDYYRVFINRGLAHFKLDNHEAAMSDFNEAIRIDPKNPLGYDTRGWAFFHSKRPRRALKEFNKSIRLGSKLAETFGMRGEILQGMKRKKRASADFKRACKLGLKTACGQ